MRHELKTLPPYFDDCMDGIKTFELRKNDRNYQINDVLILREWDGNKYTGNRYPFIITYIIKDVPQFGLKKDFVILGIR